MLALLASRKARLRVAVPARLAQLPAGGSGQVWRHALRRLERLVSLDFADLGSAPRRTPDVWLTDVALAEHDPPAQPVVCVMHEASWIRPAFRDVLEEAELQWYDAMTRGAAAKATRIVVPTGAGREELRSLTGIAPERFDVVPYGVDRSTFRPRRGGRRTVDAAGGSGLDYVLFVGIAHPKKNIGALRDAMRLLAERGHRVALALVLTPSQRSDSAALLEAAAAGIPGVPVAQLVTSADASRYTLGERDLAAVMSDALCLCLPSLGEGFGLPVLEAMACGCPIVCSDQGALPEVVGDAGLVCPPAADAVAGALERLLTDRELARRLGSTGRKRAESMTWEHTAQGWKQSLAAAVSGAPVLAAA